MDEKIHIAEWVPRPCPICKEVELLELLGHRSLKLAADDGWFIFEHYDTVCIRCGFVFNGKIPDDDFIKNYYQKTSIRVVANYDAKSRLKLIKKLLPSGSKIIEFGSGCGEFVGLLENSGYHTTGIECADRSIADTGYDAALSYYVLEHVIDPSGFLLRMRASLKEGGFMIIEVPNYHKFTEHSLYLEHLNHFSISHLTAFLTMHNLQVFQILPGHSRDFGFAAVAIKGFSRIASSKYSKTMEKIKDYWKADHG